MDTRRPSSDPSPWMPFESRRRARDEKREAVLRTALQSFLEQGYHRATLNDVAERLNITKPALYNYFRGKDDILFECWALGQERVDEFIAEIEASGGNGLARLRKLVHAYAMILAKRTARSCVHPKRASTSPFADTSAKASPTAPSSRVTPSSQLSRSPDR
jgi:AcrR family transcriptional regulator